MIAPAYDLEKYMKLIYIKIAPISNFSIKSTYHFVNKIKDFVIEKNDKIRSFHIVNIPVNK